MSDSGQVKHNDRLLNPCDNKHGYFVVSIKTRDGKIRTRAVHRLVAIAFIPNPLNNPVVNHISGDKTDNSAGNLEWTTQKDNIRKAWDMGLCSSHAGSKNGNSRLTESDVLEIRSGYDIQAVADKYGVKPQTIADILLRKSWKSV